MDKSPENKLCHLIDTLTLNKPELCLPEACGANITSNGKAITILMMNVRSVNKNFAALELLLCRLDLECDIIILTECWIENNKQFPSMTNYNKAYTKNCINQNGGVIVYSRSGIDIIIEEPSFLEANCLLLRIGVNVAIVALYRSPSFSKIDPFLDSLDSVLTNIKQFQTISVIGDLNIDIREHNYDGRSASYLELLASHGLIPSHTFPTRDNKCLDHVMLKSKCQCKTIVLDTYITDHRPVILNIVSKYANSICPKKVTTRIDLIKVGQQIKLLDFLDVLQSLDSNMATSLLMNKLMEVVKANTRLFKVPHNQRIIKPWITPGILRCIRTRDKMHTNIKENPNSNILKITYLR
ncbi:putative tick transposon [Operophtera brumata]|uniref:Putative tick transposon n=1 Tax=Operophtera brumata TaxID=104452 RepID=A0A0L7LNM7_OPEBR|nr:putative tick transposon [Operophtera brumata]